MYALGLPVDGKYDEVELLRTPQAWEGQGGAVPEDVKIARGNHVMVRDQVLQLAMENGLKVTEAAEALLPTPNTMDNLPPREGEAYELNLRRGDPNGVRREMSGNLREVVVHDVLLPTVTTSEGTGAGAHGEGGDNLRTVAANVTNWGRFEPAIRRWEKVLGRPAPAPTKPDGKEGGHRLSSKFAEFMMGLPEGWITDVGLTRTEELKACGNGVVPQQAVLALRQLLTQHDTREVTL